MRLTTSLIAILIVAMLAAPATAQRTSLRVGSKAPGLDIEHWINSDELTIEKDQAYVIEFWATWCGPCKRVTPILDELHEELGSRGLTIIGISDEDKSTVERYVRGKGDDMSYPIAVDRRKATSRSWMAAAGINGIPAAFVVDGSGIVQWIGNPLADTDEFIKIVESVCSGRYDAKLSKQAEPYLRAAKNARRVKNWKLAHKHMDDVIELDQRVFAYTALDKYEMLLLEQKDADAAAGWADEMLVTWSDDPEFLADVAEYIATNPIIPAEQRDMDLALEFAETAARVGKSDHPRGYEVQALVHFHRGDVDKAMSLQRRAFFLAVPKEKDTYRRDLEKYQEAARRTAAGR